MTEEEKKVVEPSDEFAPPNKSADVDQPKKAEEEFSVQKKAKERHRKSS